MYTCGGPAHAAVAIARLGGQARFVGHFGNDAFGHAHIQELLLQGLHRRHPLWHRPRRWPRDHWPDGQRSIVDYCSEAPSAPRIA